MSDHTDSAQAVALLLRRECYSYRNSLVALAPVSTLEDCGKSLQGIVY